MQHRPMTPIQKAALLVVRSRQDRGEPGPTLDEIAGAIGVSKSRVVAVTMHAVCAVLHAEQLAAAQRSSSNPAGPRRRH